MALSAIQILKSGLPYLPSGMLYPRGIGQSYLMALSVWTFGQSEWALRFPSAVSGSILIIISFFLGRRFLPKDFNIVFVLIIAILPSMIALSQSARMYIYFSTFATLFALMIFRWEENSTSSNLLASYIVYLISLQFHTLTVFLSPLFFYPWANKQTRKLFIQGSIGFILAMVSYLLLSHWMKLQYAGTLVSSSSEEYSIFQSATYLLNAHPVISAFVFIILLFILLYMYHVNYIKEKIFVVSIVLFSLGLFLITLLQYHIGALFLILAAIIYLRTGGRIRPLILLAVSILLLFSCQYYLLEQSGLFPEFRKVMRALNGQSSLWPYIRFSSYFPIGAIIYLLVLIHAAFRLAKRCNVPHHFLFFLLAVWIPLFLIGFIKWDVLPRYTYGQVTFFILSCIAGVYTVSKHYGLTMEEKYHRYKYLIYPVLIIAFVNPLDLERNINISYSSFRAIQNSRGVDHKGAAEYINNIHLDDNDIVIAEDALQQTYYLGHVDYWLRAIDKARKFAKIRNGKPYDLYTGAEIIGTGKALENVLNNKNRGSVYLITSGETIHEKEVYLGVDILDIIKKYNPVIIYRARDQETLIYHFPKIRMRK